MLDWWLKRRSASRPVAARVPLTVRPACAFRAVSEAARVAVVALPCTAAPVLCERVSGWSAAYAVRLPLTIGVAQVTAAAPVFEAPRAVRCLVGPDGSAARRARALGHPLSSKPPCPETWRVGLERVGNQADAVSDFALPSVVASSSPVPLRCRWRPTFTAFDALFYAGRNEMRRHAAARADDFVGVICASDPAYAFLLLGRLRRRRLTGQQRRFLGVLESAVAGAVRPGHRWGESECLDALRLRAACGVPSKTAGLWSLPIEWSGSLAFLGARLPPDCSDIEPSLIRPSSAAIAAASGYGAALQWLAPLLRGVAKPSRDVRLALRLIALRAVLEDHATPEALSVLIPSASELVAHGRGTNPWSHALLALAALAEEKELVPTALLVARIVGRSFRHRLRSNTIVRDLWPSLAQEPGGTLSFVLPRLADAGWQPWRTRRRRPAAVPVDVESLEGILADYLGTQTGSPTTWEVYLEPYCLSAALLGLAGQVMSARTHLATAKAAGAPAPAVDAVSMALKRKRPGYERFRGWLDRQAADPELRCQLGRLKVAPDPNVATGTPVWCLTRGRQNWYADLMKRRQGGAARALRNVLLNREDLRTLHEPYWLLRDTDVHRKALVSLLEHVFRSSRYPERGEWIQAAGELARDMWEEM